VKLTTEDGKSLIISFDEKGNFKSYFVNREDITAQMAEGSYIKERINQVIDVLNNLTWSENRVDGETMQYILEKVGMQDQMVRQLMFSAPRGYVEDLWEEIIELEKSHD
jgi:K+/H+ antiporter YhaU regulatory subunit KhtT